jgi:hypothetical protein
MRDALMRETRRMTMNMGYRCRLPEFTLRLRD